jgi:hypothetical protein
MEVQRLREEQERLKRVIEHHEFHTTALSNTCLELQEVNTSLTREVITAKNLPPFIKLERDKASLLMMIGRAILFILSVVMHKTQSFT